MILPALLALATGVQSLPMTHSFGRVTVKVKHPGASVPVLISIRTKQTIKEEWTYFRDLKTYPRNPRSSPIGRRATITLPPKGELKRFVQVCSLYQPDLKINDAASVSVGLESCANVHFR